MGEAQERPSKAAASVGDAKKTRPSPWGALSSTEDALARLEYWEGIQYTEKRQKRDPTEADF